MNRKRREMLLAIRYSLAVEYHRLSNVLLDDDPLCSGKPEGEIDNAFEKVSEAIDCINREVDRPEGG